MLVKLSLFIAHHLNISSCVVYLWATSNCCVIKDKEVCGLISVLGLSFGSGLLLDLRPLLHKKEKGAF